MKKYKISYRSVLFIEKAIAYTFQLPKNDEEKAFMKKNEEIVLKFLKKYPRLNYAPFEAYQYGCSLFSKYSDQEKMWIWSENSDMSTDNANSFWKLLKISAEESVGSYYTRHFFYRIKIFFHNIYMKVYGKICDLKVLLNNHNK